MRILSVNREFFVRLSGESSFECFEIGDHVSTLIVFFQANESHFVSRKKGAWIGKIFVQIGFIPHHAFCACFDQSGRIFEVGDRASLAAKDTILSRTDAVLCVRSNLMAGFAFFKDDFAFYRISLGVCGSRKCDGGHRCKH